LSEGKIGLLQKSSQSVFGNHKKPVRTQGKSVMRPTAGTNSQIPKCPRGCIGKVWRDGHRHVFYAWIQRWSCCVCGLKFSDPQELARAKESFQKVEMIESKELKTPSTLDSNRQICVLETKNLVAEPESALVIPQKREYDIQDYKGAVIKFLFYLQKNERAKVTYQGYGYNLNYLIEHGANLFDPENVKTVMTDKENGLGNKSDSRKYNLLKAYKAFMNAYGIKGNLLKYNVTRKLPYLPPEQNLDLLIASCGGEMAAFLQTLKETAARPEETMRLLWEEIDFAQNKIQLNHPAKKCNPRTITMSSKLSEMLKTLPKNRDKVFGYKNTAVASKTFRVMRKRAIAKLGMMELRKIHLYTFRYWRATVEFQEYQTEAAVMVLLGHKSTKYLWLYVQLAHVYFGGVKKYVSLWVHNREEESLAVEQGFEYVRTDSKDGASLCRKPDRTSAAVIGHD
jgi:integrase